MGFFEDLYTRENNVQPELVLNQVEMKVTEGMNSDLCKDFSEKEISDAMF
jgi:Flp pilus assembly CpaE family ATPase